MKQIEHNPDVLNCIANLSNDEVFTPPVLVNQMLDLLPQELFNDPNSTFLDPFTKTGVYLREIVKRLDKGLEKIIPDRQERINHILHKQVFGIAITELTALLSRRTLYCSKFANGEHSISHFDTPEGNIWYQPMKHTWVYPQRNPNEKDEDYKKRVKCKFCGANQTVYDRGENAEQYAYPFIHLTDLKSIYNMKFSVICGNPPYQLADGGNSASAKPIYNLFVECAKSLKPDYLSLIIPARWYSGGKGLDSFRDTMLSDKHISKLIDYSNSADCFAGVNIAGGVCYFLWENSNHDSCEIINYKNGAFALPEVRSLSEFNVFVRDNSHIKLIRKIRLNNERTMDNMVFSRNSFTIPSNERGHSIRSNDDYSLVSSDGISYISKHQISDREAILNKYKVVITYAMSGGNKPGTDGKYQIVSSLSLLKPEEVCTETYLVLGAFANKSEAENLMSYVKTKFFRFLMLQSLSSIHITKSVFQFVPIQDFSKPWTDQELFKKYHLTDEEVLDIESVIKDIE